MQYFKQGKLKPGKTAIHLVSVQQGQIVPAASPLLQLVDQNQRFVRLGVEPENYVRLQLN